MKFIPLNFTCLSNIQIEISQILKIPSYNDSTLFYPDNHINLFLSSPSLRKELENFNLIEHILAIGVVVVDAGKRIPIHMDNGGYIFSLNIPISGYDNSYLNFYKPIVETYSITMGEGRQHTYKKFDIDKCSVIDSYETNIPYIMDTQIPHDVVNNSNTTRVCLLVRLNNQSNEKIDKLWKSYGESNPACLDENQMS